MILLGFISMIIGIYYLPTWEATFKKQRRSIPKWYSIALSVSAFATIFYIPAVISILLNRFEVNNGWILLISSFLCYVGLYKIYTFRIQSQTNSEVLRGKIITIQKGDKP